MSKYDFIVRYKHDDDTDWNCLGLNKDYFPKHACDEDISIEIREYLYVDLEERHKRYYYGPTPNTEELDEIIDYLTFERGSLFDEALYIHDKLNQEKEDIFC